MAFSISRRSLLTGTAAGVSLGVVGTALAVEQKTQARAAATAGHLEKPNVILIVTDTTRRDHIGAYGNDWIQTPNLDKLAAASLRFTRAVPEAMPTVPARRSIHSGMRTFPFRNWVKRSGNESGVWGWQHIPDDQPTLAELLSAGGYTTILVSDNPHTFKPSMNFARGFKSLQWIRGQEGDDYMPPWLADDRLIDRYLYQDAGGEELTSKGENLLLANELRQYLANNADRVREEDYLCAKVFRTAARMLESTPPDQPFFMSIDSFDPHEPWDAPRHYADLYDPDYADPEPVSPRYGKSDYLTQRQLKRMRALYAGELTMVDRWIGYFMRQAEQLGLLENTLVIMTSDHGMALGEHGALGKPSFALWPEMTDTPFFIRHPDGKRAGEAMDYFASTHDIAPTILSFVGIEPETRFDGVDLMPTLDGKMPSDSRDHFTSGMNNYVWVSDRQYTMISKNDGSDAKLYDIVADPDQQNDIAADNPDIVEQMFALVLEDAGGEPLPSYG
ncbi:Arylsulfatase (plasmid) [Martelella mediterranea DSM 17316]|jgi:arylsulfatase A-like enzyme|uniref:Arylsulfatase n=1 Tax=Martelella mediterranea DSM 17316 TaxID=1122214 RepID=A0A1U9Z9P6_9HYPH|nr:sulfatase [Martelella mediterranea]AQZ54360.1 Arylsulfatase [Martelella mediterranea DSM 17316]